MINHQTNGVAGLDVDALLDRIRQKVKGNLAGQPRLGDASAASPSPASQHETALGAQADFNSGLLPLLQAIAACLEDQQRTIDSLKENLRRQEEQGANLEARTVQLAESLTETAQAVQRADAYSRALDVRFGQEIEQSRSERQQGDAARERAIREADERAGASLRDMHSKLEDLAVNFKKVSQRVVDLGAGASELEDETKRGLADVSKQFRELRSEVEARIQMQIARQVELNQQTAAHFDRFERILQEATGTIRSLENRMDDMAMKTGQKFAEAQQNLRDFVKESCERLREEAERGLAGNRQALEDAGRNHFAALADLDMVKESCNRLRDEVERGLAGQRQARDEAGRNHIAALAHLEQRLRSQAEEQATRLAAQAGQVEAQLTTRLGEADHRFEAGLEQIVSLSRQASHELEEIRIRILRAERKMRSMSANGLASRHVALETSKPESAEPVDGIPAARPARPFDYFLFEQRFRGSIADIKQRQAIYLDLFRDRQAVLDVGCGRGEFLELLGEHGVPVTGVDADEDMADYCRDRGLPVVCADAFGHLEGLADAGLDGVFAAQLIEHFTLEQMRNLVGLCAAKLRLGGVAVLETINPGCPSAMNWFYLDPTHTRPVPPDLLRFLLEQELFEVRLLRFSSPLPGAATPAVLDVIGALPPEAALYQDYAAVAAHR